MKRIERKTIHVQNTDPFNDPFDRIGIHYSIKKGTPLQDAVNFPRNEDQYNDRLDLNYMCVYGHEADLPIIYEWFENIPEGMFFREIVLRYIEARNHKRVRGLSDMVAMEAKDVLRGELKKFFKEVENLRGELTTVKWTLEMATKKQKSEEKSQKDEAVECRTEDMNQILPEDPSRYMEEWLEEQLKKIQNNNIQ